MADAKKGGKKGAIDLDALVKAIGAKIRITTSLPGTTIQGTIFTACKQTSLVAIKDSNSQSASPASVSASPGTYHIVSISQIASYEILAPASEADGEATSLPTKVDHDALKQREEQAIREAKKYEASRGKDVTREAQEMFDHCARTLPTRWDTKNIVINDAVVLSPPYSPNDLKAPPTTKKDALAQIKRVVEGYWSKKNGGKPPAGQGQAGGKTNVGNSRPGVVMPIPPRKGG